MHVLGLETSCDETAASVVRDGVGVLSNTIASQHELHMEYGGVVPEIASRAHVERILPIVERALDDAGLTLSDIDAVAVGHRPGLIGALLVGVAAAKALSWSLGVPLIGVDHVQAHLYAGLLDDAVAVERAFPALGLVVSGGHTALYDVRSPLELRRLGSTIDDAVGEAYDKVAAMLGLEHPGGPKVDRLAGSGNERAHDFPISRLDRDSLDFSFSGVKTAVLYTVRGQPMPGQRGMFERDHRDLDDAQIADVAASFQRVACAAVRMKVERALDRVGPVQSLLVGGGVSANSRLREVLLDVGRSRDIEVRLPAMEHCVDNAAMIAGLAWHRLQAGLVDDLTLAASPRSEIG
ncbi:MAG: tRNA (adenosine(37)-N6)-threonylcarbamoyltransferase complex transferase subunit TsaD [Planctomycetota bacterium]